MSAPQSYYVPVDAGEAEFTEKRSHFLGHVRRVETEAEARAFLDEMRKKYYDARHNCWCYVLHEGGVVRYGDDGEPQGTAGQPMLNVFQREGVENVVCASSSVTVARKSTTVMLSMNIESTAERHMKQMSSGTTW